MRVLRIIARMNVGGPARQVVALHHPERGLAARGYEQRLLIGTVGPGEADELALRAPDIDAVVIPGLGRAPQPWDDARALASISAEIRRFRPDIVHTHTAKAGALGRLATWVVSPRTRTVHTFHGHLLQGYFRPAVRAGVVGAERAMAWRTTRLAAVGSRVRDELVAAGVGRPEQYAVVPPGVDLPPPLAQDAARAALGLHGDVGLVVGFAGRLTAIKRPDRLISAVADLVARGVRVKVLVAGQGDLEADMRAQVSASGLDDSVLFLGLRADIEVFWAACDVAVVTSDNEGMPMALIEASLVGRPSVTTDVGSASEVVAHDETGLVVPADAAAIASALETLAGDAGLRDRMGTAARERAEALFSAARLVDRTAELYASLKTPGLGERDR